MANIIQIFMKCYKCEQTINPNQSFGISECSYANSYYCSHCMDATMHRVLWNPAAEAWQGLDAHKPWPKDCEVCHE